MHNKSFISKKSIVIMLGKIWMNSWDYMEKSIEDGNKEQDQVKVNIEKKYEYYWIVETSKRFYKLSVISIVYIYWDVKHNNSYLKCSPQFIENKIKTRKVRTAYISSISVYELHSFKLAVRHDTIIVINFASFSLYSEGQNCNPRVPKPKKRLTFS